MAAYIHHHGNNPSYIPPSDSQQTLILMNPSLSGFSDTHHHPPIPTSTSNFSSSSDSLFHANPPPPSPHQFNTYTSTATATIHHYNPWSQGVHGQGPPLVLARDYSPRAQQGLSLTLSSQNLSPRGLPTHNQPDQFPYLADSIPLASSASMVISSKYLKAAQEILLEVVNVGQLVTGETANENHEEEEKKKKNSSQQTKGKEEEIIEVATKRGFRPELGLVERQEIQVKKGKLMTLLDEVEQRHRQYRHQMKIVVSSFEQTAGSGSARAYTALALKTISKQFRALRDAILGQVRIARKSLGEEEQEEEDGGGGSLKGSRLRFLGHQLQQQRAIQMMQHNAWRPQRGLPEKAVSVLRAWLFEHFLHPYPKDFDKITLAKQTGLTRGQVSNWFINARVRLWKPMIERMYAEEIQEHEEINGSNDKMNEFDRQQDNTIESVPRGKITEAGNSENQNSSQGISSSTNSMPSFRAATENVSGFTLIGSLETEDVSQGSLKKQRSEEKLYGQSTHSAPMGADKEEILMMRYDNEKSSRDGFSIMPPHTASFLGELGSYPVGELGRFGAAGQFQTSFSGNGVSLSLGLPPCETLSLSGPNQSFYPNSQTIHQFRERLDVGDRLNSFGVVKAADSDTHSRGVFAPQLLPDFVT